jgi:lactate permease
VIILGVAMAAVQYVVVTAGFWNLGAMVAGAAGLLLVFPLAARIRGPQTDNGKLEIRPLLVAISGYAVLVLVILFVQLVHPVRDFLSQFVIQVPIPELRTSLGHVTPAGSSRSLYVFRHTGVVLFYAAVLAFLIYGWAGWYSPGALGRIVSGTVRRVAASSVSIASMVSMAVIMETSGMTATLALSLAAYVGILYPLIAPWIGAIGAFMTGSNTNSNVVFAALQLRTAALLGYDAAVILAAQTAGAAVASIMAPTKVVVGASTGGMAGREGEVMRKLAVYTALLLLLLSTLAAIGVWVVY